MMPAMITRQPSGVQKPYPIVFVHGAWHGAWCWEEHFLDYFAQHGYVVLAFDLRQHGAAVDLLICDVVMPELGGPELVRYLATLGTEPRVLFISGYNEEATHAELGHPFLAKPFTAVSLAQAIEQALAE